MKRFLYYIPLILLLTSCYHEQEIPVIIDFEYSIANSSYTVPVTLDITNRTTGADFYTWTFAGASPATADTKQPGAITYNQAGTYTIRLEAWNDTQRTVKEITVLLDSAVTVDFTMATQVNDFSPATIAFTNLTRGASSYAWTFEGGTPETSTSADPGPIVFTEPGDHNVTLTVTNGRESYTVSKVVTVKPAMAAAFEIIPSFEDEDYEAPLKATLSNNTISGLRYTWTATSGAISDNHAETPDIFFSNPGDYTVTLTVENDKETQTIDRTIHVKPNSNLYTMTDVRLGVSAAQNTIGCFYSCAMRQVLKKSDVTTENAPSIDLVFYSVNSSFGYCRFISPDSAAKFTFPAIPQAKHTSIINTQESGVTMLSAEQFDAMTDDSPLANLSIAANDTRTNYFTNSLTPRIVLFRTADGRTGAVRIKSFVSDGAQSYILADIKVQKLKP